MKAIDHVPLPDDSQIPPHILEELKKYPPLNIHRLLTWVPECWESWMNFMHGIYLTDFNPKLREIAICRYGFKNAAKYELFQHVPLALKSGVSQRELDILRSESPVVSLLDEENFVCRVVDEFEDLAGLSEPTFQELLSRYETRKAMQLLMILGHYCCVTRVLNATRLPCEAVSPLQHFASPAG